MEKCFQILDSWLRTLPPLPLPAHPLPYHQRMSNVRFACDLFELHRNGIHALTYLMLKRYCIVSKCFANTLAERRKGKIL